MKQNEEDQVMAVPEYNNDIKRLLGLKGNTRLEIQNQLTQRILEYDYTDKTPGIGLRFLETKKRNREAGEWIYYNILFEARKYQDTPEYLSHILGSLSKVVKIWGDYSNIDVVGIQEVDCEEADYYYILIYILSDGKDKEKLESDRE